MLSPSFTSFAKPGWKTPRNVSLPSICNAFSTIQSKRLASWIFCTCQKSIFSPDLRSAKSAKKSSHCHKVYNCTWHTILSSFVSIVPLRNCVTSLTKKLDACEIEQSRTSSVCLYTTKQMLIHFHSWLIKIALEEEKALSRLRFSSATKHIQTHSNVKWNFATSNSFKFLKAE